jgi:GntR family transcriptional regulator/MocR family aminotransferase
MKYQFPDDDKPLYLRVYGYYKNMITDGTLTPGQKIPSIRRCAEELQISRTTVENAYMSLAADGYIISRKNSGFYVSSICPADRRQNMKKDESRSPEIIYNFSSAGADRESFNFDMWRRYIKSALRQDERLLSYGEPQGEYELREAIASFISSRRNVVCSPYNIVVGAGVQSLLHILCSVIGEKKKISFSNPDFRQGTAVFRDHGWTITDDDPDVIYVNPSSKGDFGDVMTVEERFSLIKSAMDAGRLIIEDDYGNEFSYFSGRAPSLQSLASGKNVVYTGTFSRLLLPSIRMSYMVLPDEMMEKYLEVAADYNQTASKTEQIALCQFIRDGHMDSQIRKLKKLYAAKSAMLAEIIKKTFGDSVKILPCGSGVMVKVRFDNVNEPEKLKERAAEKGLKFKSKIDENGGAVLLLSCTSVKTEELEKAVLLIKEVI